MYHLSPLDTLVARLYPVSPTEEGALSSSSSKSSLKSSSSPKSSEESSATASSSNSSSPHSDSTSSADLSPEELQPTKAEVKTRVKIKIVLT